MSKAGIIIDYKPSSRVLGGVGRRGTGVGQGVGVGVINSLCLKGVLRK